MVWNIILFYVNSSFLSLSIKYWARSNVDTCYNVQHEAQFYSPGIKLWLISFMTLPFFLLSLLLFRLFTFTSPCSQVSYWLMKRLAVSGDVTWCLNQLFTSVTRLHVFSECGPAVNLSCLWHLECVNVSGLEVLWSWKRKSVSSHSITQVSGYNAFSFSLYTYLWD